MLPEFGGLPFAAGGAEYGFLRERVFAFDTIRHTSSLLFRRGYVTLKGQTTPMVMRGRVSACPLGVAAPGGLFYFTSVLQHWGIDELLAQRNSDIIAEIAKKNGE